MKYKGSEIQKILWMLKRGWIVVAIFSGIANLLMLSPTLYMLQVYDRVLVSQNSMTLLIVSAITIFMLSLLSFSDLMRSRMLVRLGIRIDRALSIRIFNSSVSASTFDQNYQPGKGLSDLLEIRQFLTGHGAIAFLEAPWTPIYIVVLFLLHPILGATACLFSIFQLLLALYAHKKASITAQALEEAFSKSSQNLKGNLIQAESIHVMGLWPKLQMRWMKWHQNYLNTHATSYRSTHKVTALSKGLRYSQQSFSLAAGAWLVIHGEISAGSMVASNVLMNRALAPIDQIVGMWQQWLKVRNAYQRIDDLLTHNPFPDRTLHAKIPSGDIRISELNAYANQNQKPIIEKINLQIKAGTINIIMGPSGSGKSTLSKVILGIWPNTSGTVVLDGVNIHEWERDKLGQYLGYLPQNVELFNGTVAQNIARFGEISPNEVVEAAQRAQLHDVILKMPQGYDTIIGYTGDRLSGGQQQRVGLARALYGKPSLIVLDEPDAHLDSSGESALRFAVQNLKKNGQTVVLITHRKSIAELADNLIILYRGKIKWQGPPQEALKLINESRQNFDRKN